MKARGACFLFWCGLSTLSATAGETLIEVRSAGYAAGVTPIRVEVETDQVPAGVYRLEGDGEAAIPGLVFDLDGKRWLGAVLPGVSADASKRYRLVAAAPEAVWKRYETGEDVPGQSLAIEAGGELFARLVFSERSKPYVHPLNGPGGVPFTRGYPMLDRDDEEHDHPHQRSLWFTHGDVNGYDFWASDPLNGQNPKFGSIRAREIEVLAPAALTVVRHGSDWNDSEGKPVLSDQRTFVFYGSASPRFVDVDVTLRADHGDVKFGDTKEGMFGLRVASSLDVKRGEGGHIVNSEGQTDGAAWGKAAAWVDYSGRIGGHEGGIAVLNRPGSYGYPTHWHVRDYGLFAANPFGLGAFGESAPGEYTLRAGEAIRFGYRIVLHEGKLDTEQLSRLFRAYATPPRVEIRRP